METTKVAHDSETPAPGQQVMSACAFIHQNHASTHKLFLPKRADTKKFLPGLYELPGGHIDYGEELIPGLRREIKEEFGMTITVGDPFAAFTYENPVKGSHTIEVVYFATFVESVDSITLQPEDHSDYHWFTNEEVIARRGEISAAEYLDHDVGDDPEFATILKGFAIVSGQRTYDLGHNT